MRLLHTLQSQPDQCSFVESGITEKSESTVDIGRSTSVLVGAIALADGTFRLLVSPCAPFDLCS